MTEAEIKELHAKMTQMAEELIEHAEGVVILLSFMDEDRNGRYSRLLSQGRGNHYLREGMALDYVCQMVQNNRADEEEGYK